MFRVKWQEPQQAKLRNGYKVYSSPPPGSGLVVESILKIYDKLKTNESRKSNKDDYLDLLESFKFAFAQRSKLGDTFNSPYKCEIEKVVDNIWKICSYFRGLTKWALVIISK